MLAQRPILLSANLTISERILTAQRSIGDDDSNKVPRHMNNKQHTRNFTRSDDALILEQPVTRIGVKILARMLHTSQERVMHRADELGVSLAISDDHDGAVDTQTLRRLDLSTHY